MNKLALSFLAAAVVGLTSWASAAQEKAPTLNLCTGGENNAYFNFGGNLKKNLGDRVLVNPIVTRGAEDNFRRLQSGECDAAILQGDAWKQYAATNPNMKLDIELTARLFPEYGHFVCNEATKVSSLYEMGANPKGYKMLIGDQGGGSGIMWWNIVEANKDRYRQIGFEYKGLTQSLSEMTSSNDPVCMLFVSAIGTGNITTANGFKGLKLISVNDDKLAEITDRNHKIYEVATIPEDTYSNLNPDPGMFSSNDISTLSTKAILVTKVDWMNSHEQAYNDYAMLAMRMAGQDFKMK